MGKTFFPDSTQLDTLNGHLSDISETLGGQNVLTRENLISLLGYEPVKPEGNYELIETITLTEDMAAIERTQEPDGTAYNFKALLFQATIQPTSVSGANYTLAVLVGCGSKKLAIGYIDNAVSTSSALTCYGECDEHRGFANFRCANGMSNLGSNTTQRGSSNSYLLEPFDNITYFRLRFPVISIPSGSVVKIYAVRS